MNHVTSHSSSSRRRNGAFGCGPSGRTSAPQWTGFYLGINAGGTWSSNNSVDTTSFFVTELPGFDPLTNTSQLLATTRVPVSISGFIGGGQWGYNYQWNNWVFGVEGDFQGIASSNRTGTLFSTATAVVAGVDFDWLGTDRGRIGFLIWPTFLVYGTGGLAYGQTQTNVAIGQIVVNPVLDIVSTPALGTFRQALAGWTAGGGLEWLFLPNWASRSNIFIMTSAA
jgi:outer membrane immunogenic protein